MQSLWVNDDVCFMVEHRDRGPSLHVLVRTPARPPEQETRRFQEMIRFDCFREAPHYHDFGPHGEVTHDLPTEWDVATSVERCLKACAEKLPLFAEEVGYPKLILTLTGIVTAEHIATLRQWMMES